MVSDGAVRSDITKRMLAASLKKLLAEKPLHAITVTEVTALCGLHRQTFYYHFQDTADLLRWLFEDEAKMILGRTDVAACWQDMLLEMFQYLDDNRKFCISVFRSIGRETLREYFSSDLTLIVGKIISGYVGEIAVEDRNVEFLTAFYLGAMLGIFERWILGELSLTPEEIVMYTGKMAEAQFAGAKAVRGKGVSQ